MPVDHDIMPLPNAIESAVACTRKTIRRGIATLWQYTYRVQYRFNQWRLRYRSSIFSAVFLLFVSASVYLSPTLQTTLEPHYATDGAIQSLRSLILSTGSALTGAAAIVMSLVLFAMQVNIERMPHGLFRRLSADLKLLGAFALAFLLAIGVATLSTLVDQARLAHVVLAASGAVLCILILFMYAYRRALVLINPKRQLEILMHDTRKELGAWARRAQRAKPLFEREKSESATSSSTDSTHDLARTAYFQIYSRWTDGAKRNIRHAMSFTRRYAEHGDYEVSDAALNAVVSINAEYIKAKARLSTPTTHLSTIRFPTTASSTTHWSAYGKTHRVGLRAGMSSKLSRYCEPCLNLSRYISALITRAHMPRRATHNLPRDILLARYRRWFLAI